MRSVMNSENFLTSPEMARKSKYEHDKGTTELREGIDRILTDGHSMLIPGYTPIHIRNQILAYLKRENIVRDKQQAFPTIQIHGVIIEPEELERMLPNFRAVEELK